MTFTLTNFSVSSNFVQEPRFCTIFSLYQDLSSISICHVAFLHVFFQVSDSHMYRTAYWISIQPDHSSSFQFGFHGCGDFPIPTYSIWNFMVPQRLLRIFSYVERKIFGLFFHTAQSMQPPLLLCLLPLQVTLHSVVYTLYLPRRRHESPLGY